MDMAKKHLVQFFIILCLLQLMGCTASSGINSRSSSFMYPASLADSSTLWRDDTAAIWAKLQHTSLAKLKTELGQSKETIAAGWLKLAIISKEYGTEKTQLINQLMTWRNETPAHPGNTLFPDNTTLNALLNTALPKHIVLLLPLEGPYATQGKAVRDGFLNAYYQSLEKQNLQQTIAFIDTSKTTNMSSLYNQALGQGADMIIGPLTKENVQLLNQQNNTFAVPTLELNYTDTWGSLPTNVYQFGLSPQDEAEQVAEKARSAGLTHAILIAPQTEWGQRVSKSLISRWGSVGGSVVDTLYFSGNSNLAEDIPRLLHINPQQDRSNMQQDNNKTLLEKQRRQDFDVIFLLAPSDTAREIVPLLKYYYAAKIPIYATSIIYSGTPAPQKDVDLNGVIFCDIPWVLSGHSGNRLSAVGHDSYIISNELPILTTLPNFPIYAATGALTLTSKHQIYRRLPWAQIHEGHP
jgi:hypothetical protein